MKIITAAVFYLVYWFICFLCTGTDKKNLAGLRSYPDEVQARVRREPQLAGSIPKAKSMPAGAMLSWLAFLVFLRLTAGVSPWFGVPACLLAVYAAMCTCLGISYGRLIRELRKGDYK